MNNSSGKAETQISFSLHGKFAFVKDVPIAAKNEDYVSRFVLLNPTFTGTVTVMKDTKYKEDDGSTYQRYYEYEVEPGKFRKKRYSGTNTWKEVSK